MSKNDFKDIEKELLEGQKILDELEGHCLKLIDVIRKQKKVNMENIERIREAMKIQTKEDYIKVSVVLEPGFAQELLSEGEGLYDNIKEYITILANLGIIKIEKK